MQTRILWRILKSRESGYPQRSPANSLLEDTALRRLGRNASHAPLGGKEKGDRCRGPLQVAYDLAVSIGSIPHGAKRGGEPAGFGEQLFGFGCHRLLARVG
jgi:hypothetical protein